MAGNGNLNLTGESFEKLKSLIDDLTKSANQAKEAIAGIFNSGKIGKDWSKSLNDAVKALNGVSKKNSNKSSDSSKSKDKSDAAKAAAKLIEKAARVDAKLKDAAAKAAAKVIAQAASLSAKATKQAASASAKATTQAANLSAKATKQAANLSAKAIKQAANLSSRMTKQAANASARLTKQAASLSAKITAQSASTAARMTTQAANLSSRMTRQAANAYARATAQASAQQAAQARAAARMTTQAANASARITIQAANASARLTSQAARARAAQVISAARAANAAAKPAATKKSFLNMGFIDRLVQASTLKERIRIASSMFFGGKSAGQQYRNQNGKGGSFANTGGNLFSRYGGAGALGGVLGKFRVFQKPFPGSERNQFALGDSTAAFANIIHGAGMTVKGVFSGLTSAASLAAKGLASIPVGIVSLLNPAVGALLSSVNDMFFGIFNTLSAAISGVIGSLTNLSTALLGFASRAVESASKFTETVNAAKVVTGVETGNKLKTTAIELQRNYGLSAIDSMRGMGRIAGMLVQQGGFTQKEAGIQSEEIARQLADVASVNNRNIEDLMRDMMSGLAGRFTPMRKNMMGFQAPVLDIMAKNKGIANPNLRTDLVARTKMFIGEFTRQAGLFAGDLENTRFEFANQKRKFLGGFEALFMSVGQILEPFAKVVLFAANDLMDQLLSIIEPFAVNPFQTFKTEIESFASYVSYAKNVIISMVKQIWSLRQEISELAINLANFGLEIARAVLNITLAVLNGAFAITDAFGGIVATSELLASSLQGLSRLINFLSGGPMMGAIVGGMAAPLLAPLVGPVGPLVGPLIGAMVGGVGKPNKNKPFDRVDVMQKKLMDNLGKIDLDMNDVLDWFKNAAPAAAKAGNVAPQDPLAAAGRMVQYFDPAAFRDAVQEREMGVQTRIANAAEKILLVLEKPDPLHPKIAGPMAVPIGLGAMGVLEGMKRVAKP